MPEEKSLTKFIYDKLESGGWPDLTLEEKRKLIDCPKGKVLSFTSNKYTLTFYSYSQQTNEYYERDTYKSITFPKSFDIRNFLWIKQNGNFKISYESQFKKILNPTNKRIEKINISTGTKTRRFYGTTLTISKDVFINTIAEATSISKRKKSYANSAENYLANLASFEFTKETKQRTTYLNKGEFTFLIDRFNLSTKKQKQDFEKYLDNYDISSLEEMFEGMIKNSVFSDGFLRQLDEYFIKEKLRDIIKWGKDILALKSSDLSTNAAQSIITKLDLEEIDQLETLWQKYYEKYLLYLIFSYKKIFPKIELKDIGGDKKYPDFIGVNHYNGLDVIEIKTHLTKILSWDSSHKNFYFTAEMSKAIVQTSNYLDSISKERFKTKLDRNRITSFTDEENLYHPRGIIIISSNEKLSVKKDEAQKLNRDFTKLRNSVQNIEIITFDEILGIADEYIKNIVDDN